jgi:hypothetical protein
MDYEIVQVCNKTLYAPMPTIISEATMNITKFTTFGNFPRMFLQVKIRAQNTFGHGVDLVGW